MSTGFIPRPIRNVKPFVAIVQDGDSVSRIAKRMTGDASRWTELVGANLHKKLSPGNVAGSPFRVFESLNEGEELFVPAQWPNPDGTVGMPWSGTVGNGAPTMGSCWKGMDANMSVLEMTKYCNDLIDQSKTTDQLKQEAVSLATSKPPHPKAAAMFLAEAARREGQAGDVQKQLQAASECFAQFAPLLAPDQSSMLEGICALMLDPNTSADDFYTAAEALSSVGKHDAAALLINKSPRPTSDQCVALMDQGISDPVGRCTKILDPNTAIADLQNDGTDANAQGYPQATALYSAEVARRQAAPPPIHRLTQVTQQNQQGNNVSFSTIPSYGAPTIDTGTVVTNILTALNTALPGTVTPPAGYNIPDVSGIIASWYPYIAQIQPPVLPTTPAVPTTQSDIQQWVQLIASAIAFLKAANIPTGSVAPVLNGLPWDQIPWNQIPWQQIAQTINPNAMSQFWQLIANATVQSPTNTQRMRALGHTGAAAPASINYFDPSTWTSPPFAGVNSVGWQNVPWSGTGAGSPDWTKVNDPELLSCMAANPARVAQLSDPKYASCFTGDMTKLKLYVCNPQLDPSTCTQATPPTNVVPPGINWGCTPIPQCIASQLSTNKVPDPCSPMPGCIPQWYQTTTGQALPTPSGGNPPAQTTTQHNWPLYVGLGAAGIALVAGILVIAAAD